MPKYCTKKYHKEGIKGNVTIAGNRLFIRPAGGDDNLFARGDKLNEWLNEP
jgi:hypothetical protein